MKITKKDHKGLTYTFHFTITSDEIETKLHEKLQDYGKKAKVPGFRPGKIPLPVLKQKFEDHFLGEVIDQVIQETIQNILTENKLQMAVSPEVKIEKFDKGTDLEASAIIEVLPEIKDIDFSKIELEKWLVNVDDKEVEKSMGNLKESRKSFEKITEDREAKKGDTVVIDFVGKIDGTEFPGGKASNHYLELGSNQFIPGFEDQLIGAKTNTTQDVSVTFPKNYHAKDLANKKAIFTVTVKELRQKTLPEINDAFAKEIGFKDLTDLKNYIKEQLAKNYAQSTDEKMKRDLLDVLAEKYSFDIPPRLSDQEFQQIWKNVEEAKKSGTLDPSDQGKSDKELEKDYKKISERRVKLGLILADIGKKNQISIQQEDVMNAIRAEAQKYPGQEQKVFEYYQKNPTARQSLQGPLMEEKIVSFILSKVKTKEKMVKAEELFEKIKG